MTPKRYTAERIQKAAEIIYLVADTVVADEVSGMLRQQAEDLADCEELLELIILHAPLHVGLMNEYELRAKALLARIRGE